MNVGILNKANLTVPTVTPHFQAVGTRGSSEKRTVWEKAQSTGLAALEFIEEIFWRYVDEANSLSQHILTIVSEVSKEFSDKLSSVISKLGVLSIINCFFALKSIPSSFDSLIDHIKTKDTEGTLLSLFDLAATPIEILESIGSFAEALASFGLVPEHLFFSMIALPLGMTLVGISAFKGLYDLITCSINFSELPKTLDDNNVQEFKAYLKSKIGVTVEERKEIEDKNADLKTTVTETEYKNKIKGEITILKTRKRNILTRRTDIKVTEIMQNLKKHLKNARPELGSANLAVSDMRTILERKITWGSISLALDTAYIATLASSIIFPISSFAVPAVGGIRAAFAIGKHHYMHSWLYFGLNAPTFTKP